MQTKSMLHKKQPTALDLIATKTEACIDTRLLAQHLETQHESLFKLVTTHRGTSRSWERSDFKSDLLQTAALGSR